MSTYIEISLNSNSAYGQVGVSKGPTLYAGRKSPYVVIGNGSWRYYFSDERSGNIARDELRSGKSQKISGYGDGYTYGGNKTHKYSKKNKARRSRKSRNSRKSRK